MTLVFSVICRFGKLSARFGNEKNRGFQTIKNKTFKFFVQKNKKMLYLWSLKDAQNRYKEIEEICNELELEELLQYSTFAFHALMLLGEINCDRSLDLALNFLKMPDNEEFSNQDFIDFYIGDIITEDLWMVFYRLGIGREQKLCDFFFEKHIDEFTKCPACNALQQIALHHKEKTKEIQGYYRGGASTFC